MRSALFLAIWVSLIFGTSCTVIRPSELFDLVNRYVLPSPEGLARFKLLWAYIWILVVKGWHFAEFAILQWFATGAVDWLRKSRSQINVLIAAIGCVLFAISDEWHQTLVPDRYGTVWDVFVDSFGVATTAYVLARLRRPVSTAESQGDAPCSTRFESA